MCSAGPASAAWCVEWSPLARPRPDGVVLPIVGKPERERRDALGVGLGHGDDERHRIGDHGRRIAAAASTGDQAPLSAQPRAVPPAPSPAPCDHTLLGHGPPGLKHGPMIEHDLRRGIPVQLIQPGQSLDKHGAELAGLPGEGGGDQPS